MIWLLPTAVFFAVSAICYYVTWPYGRQYVDLYEKDNDEILTTLRSMAEAYKNQKRHAIPPTVH